MFRTTFLGTVAALAMATAAPAQDDGQPTSYELQINGETFRVEANRMAKLKSTAKPGTTYEVAVRVAPTQLLRLNTVRLEYDLPAKAFDDGKPTQRAVRIKHELGLSMLITDLGQALEPEDQEEALKVLADSVAETYRGVKATKVEVSKPYERKFANSAGQGITVHYKDEQDFGHTCLAYVLSGPKFTVTCIVQYIDNDSDDILPLVKKALDSIRHYLRPHNLDTSYSARGASLLRH